MLREPLERRFRVEPGVEEEHVHRAAESEKTRKNAESIESVAARMEFLIKSMLDVATIEAGRFNVTVNCVCPGLVEGARFDETLASRAARDGLSPARAGELYEEARGLHSPPIPMEMTFSVYRTTKGVLGEPVHASVVVRNPRPNIAPHRDFGVAIKIIPYLVAMLVGDFVCRSGAGAEWTRRTTD